MPLPSVGERAPDFDSVDQAGRRVRLSDLRGRAVVLYFYPRDDTPGCTKEACGIRDAWKEFEARGAAVLGVSTDSAESHAKFAEKYSLPFRLVADPGKKIVEAYGVKNAFGAASRKTFLIDKEGVVRVVYPKVDPSEHAAELLRDLDRLA
ncbi:MAG: peroxiredoxin [Methanobacteriota archaeon]